MKTLIGAIVIAFLAAPDSAEAQGSYGGSGGHHVVVYGSHASGSYGSTPTRREQRKARKAERKTAKGSYGSHAYGSGSYGSYYAPAKAPAACPNCGARHAPNTAPVVQEQEVEKHFVHYLAEYARD